MIGREDRHLARRTNDEQAVAAVFLHSGDELLIGKFVGDTGPPEGPARLQSVEQFLDRRAREGEDAAAPFRRCAAFAGGTADAVMSDLGREFGAHQRIVAVVVGCRDQLLILPHVDDIVMRFIENVALIDGNVGAPGAPKRELARVGDQDLLALRLDEFGECDRPAVRANEQKAVALATVETKPTREMRSGEAVRKNGGDHDAEPQRHQRVGAGDAIVGQAEREEACNRDRDDTAGRNPCDEQPLSKRDAGGQQRQHDRQGPDHEEEQDEEGQEAELEIAHHLPIERRREQDEDAGDQNHGQILLEPQQRPARIGLTVRHHDAHHGHGDEARLVHHQVRKHEHPDHGREQHRRLQIFGHQSAREGPGECQPGKCAHDDRERARGHDIDDDRGAVRLGAAVRDIAVYAHREQRTDRIVHDRFPLEHMLDARRDIERAEQRDNHGRPGHDHDAAEQRREFPGQARGIVGRQRTERPADRYTEEYQHEHGDACMLELAKLEAEAAFEQDDRDRQFDDRLTKSPEILLGIEDAEDGPGDDSRYQHQRDGRPSGAPRDPLRADTENADQRDFDEQRVDEEHLAFLLPIACGER